MRVSSLPARWIVLVAAAHVLLGAEGQPSLGPPDLGYLFDSPSGRIRLISGVPGAALLDDAVPGDVFDFAAVAPSGRFAIARSGAGILLVRWKPEVSGAPLLDAAFAKIVFSPTGDSAALAGDGHVQVWTGLPDAPALSREIETAAEILAVSDDGGTVVAAAEDSLVIHRAGVEPRVEMSGSFSAAAFRRGSREFAAAGRDLDAIFLFRDGRPEAVWQQAAEPVALAFSLDNAWLAVANARTGSVTLLNPETGQSSETACDCRPEGLFRLRGNAVFRITDSRKSPLVLFDGDAAQPRVAAIPGGEQ